MSNNELNENNSVIGRANQAISDQEAHNRNEKTETAIRLGLALSGLFTIIYMVAALGGSLVDIGWHPLLAYPVGILLGLAAIMPGEASVWIWMTKLRSDKNINDAQVTVAWISGLIAGVSAGISTVSFFAYLLQALMPNWYNPDVAAGVNIANIAIAWIAFGLSVFVYAASGDEARINRERAKAFRLMQDAHNDLVKGIAGGFKARVNTTVKNLDEADEFFDDAMENIAITMGLSGDRLERMRKSGRGQQDALPAPPTAQEDSAQPPRETAVHQNGAGRPGPPFE